MKIEIPKITLDPFEVLGDPLQEAEFDRQEAAVKTAWESVYNAIASGDKNVAYWDCCHATQPKYCSFMRYALHQSTKKDGFLQLSVMEIRNGEIIPTSDSQHGSTADFLRHMWSFGAEIVTIK